MAISVPAHVYEGDFENWASVAHQFFDNPYFDGYKPERSTWLGEEPEAVYACYWYEHYEGSAVVVYKRDGQWFLVTGGHCSCYGLEGQWEPEAFDPKVHLDSEPKNRRYISFGYYDGAETRQTQFNDWLRQMSA
jgi:hypothetical protein